MIVCLGAVSVAPVRSLLQMPPAVIFFDAAKLSQPQHKVRMDHNVKIKMRDGIELSTDIYFPDVAGPFPTVFGRTPYNNTGGSAVAGGKWYAERGYVYVTQDVRGKYDSDGKYVLYANEANDGVDTIEWIGRQSWSNGKIGPMAATCSSLRRSRTRKTSRRWPRQ